MMQKLLMWNRLIFGLGVVNIVRNIIYRLKLKSGFFTKLTPVGNVITGPLFVDGLIGEINNQIDDEIKGLIIKEAKSLVNGRVKLFFNEAYQAGSPPQWFYHQEDIFRGHWSDSPVNKYVNKDIKLTWDLSRFHWLQQLSCAYLITKDNLYIATINDWFEDWNTNNPVNSGVNWSCAQECSIRVIHVLNSTHILGDTCINSGSLIDFVVTHCQRIEPTVDYAISQDNNHGTSEAAALFICGAWLSRQSQIPEKTERMARRYLSKGRKILEERVNKLVSEDGSFSMYSTNYHRVFLNTLSVVSFWQKKLNQNEFSNNYIQKCRSATEWLYQLVDEESGDTLNLGANDGSNPFIIQSSDYRDFRPSIQFASVIFFNEKLYKNNHKINESIDWLGITHSSLKRRIILKQSKLLQSSGIVILRSKDVSEFDSTVFIKYPYYKFRPSQADILHVDLWHKGKNILRDAGSYSYNGPRLMMDYFTSIRAHNAVEIDHTEPMPRLGPFLFADWVKMNSISRIEKDVKTLNWTGSYKTKNHVEHMRKITFLEGKWTVHDIIDGFSEDVVLRWRLKKDKWVLNNNILSCKEVRIEIEVIKGQQFKFELLNGYESRYYNFIDEIPVLEVSVIGCIAEIKTHIYL
jgi:hypothetical protein